MSDSISCVCEDCTASGDPVPYGTCHCICGEKTNPAPFTDPKRGYVKGEPVKYVKGHAARSKDWKKRAEHPGPNPSGICQYEGCEEPTLLSENTVWHLNIIRGKPLRMCPKHKHPGRKKAQLTYDTEHRGYVLPSTGLPSPCHIFNREPRNGKNGEYGMISNAWRLTHVVAWERENGPLPPGLMLHHLCEVKLCINLDHLLLCTRSEHMKLHAAARVNQETILGIQQALLEKKLTKRAIAAKFDVSLSFVYTVQRRMKDG